MYPAQTTIPHAGILRSAQDSTMIAFMPSSSTKYAPQHLPGIPSPLSPRSANIYGRQPYQMSRPSPNARLESENNGNENAPPSKVNDITRATTTRVRQVPFSSRNPKSAPLPKAKDLGDRRRDIFLRKVAGKRDEARYEARGEDMMRREFLLRQRAWEEDRAREALSQDLVLVEVGEEEEEEEEEEAEEEKWKICEGDEMEEEFLREEEGEIEALLEMLPLEEGQAGERMEEDMEEDEANFWSDGADYDELFEQVLSQQEREQQQQHQQYAGNVACQGMNKQYQQGGNDLGEEMDIS